MNPATSDAKVIVVSKRLADVCATKALLNSYGFDVATVTSCQAAQAVARAVTYQAAIICFHSFSPSERAQIEASLRNSDPNLAVVSRCPGCIGCDEQGGIIGSLPGEEWLSEIVMAMHESHP